MGNLLGVLVSAADLPDKDGAWELLVDVAAFLPRLRHLWADHAYRGDLVERVREHFGWTLEIVSKPADQVGLVVLPKRWIVERSLAWLSWYRRLARDYEYWPASSESLILLASIHRLLKRLAPAT